MEDSAGANRKLVEEPRRTNYYYSVKNCTIFISDLHLSPNDSRVINLFSKFTQELPAQVDSIYILGDLFKFWIGNDDFSEFSKQIKTILKTLNKLAPVYLIPGNRDFLLNQEFAYENQINLLNDPCRINLYKTPTLLTHGDMLCTKDRSYKILHTIIRFPLGLKIFLKLPFRLRFILATILQKFTDKTKKLKNKNKLIPQIDTIKNLLKKYSSTQIIHGHIHKIETKEFMVNGEQIRRISLGSWQDGGNMLVYYQDGNYEFKNI